MAEGEKQGDSQDYPAYPVLGNICYERSREILREDEQADREYIEDMDVGIVPNKQERIIEVPYRDRKKVLESKRQYENKCQLCGFTFRKKTGGFYSESHHLVPLSKGGIDDFSNIVVLCSRHHRMLHYANVDLSKEIENDKRKVIINGETNFIIY